LQKWPQRRYLDRFSKANEIIGHTGANVVARAASFLLLADSRASFEIEGEKPPRKRLERWGRAVVQAGKNELTFKFVSAIAEIAQENTADEILPIPQSRT